MKKEASGKKGKLWLWIVIAIVLIGAIVAGIIFLPGLLNRDKGDDGALNLYWNVDRVENTDRNTGLSIRQPAEDGNYYIRFAHNGEQVEIPVADKKLVNFIDSLDLMGLSLDENGFVVDIYPVKDIASVIGESLYVQSVSGDTIIANSSIMMNGRKITIKLSDGLAVYNVSGKGKFVGEKIEAKDLNPMDTINIYGTLVPEDSEEDPVPTHIFVLKKPAESKIYFRADQFYDSSSKSTTREPDENGAYTIKWYCEGEVVELKCKDKAMVSTIDSSDKHWCHWGLEFDEDGYIIELLDSFLGSRTLMQCERFDITEIDDAGNYVATSLIKNNGAFVQGTVGADCPIYDISSTAKSEGQDNRKVDSLKLGDRVCIWTDTMGNPVQIYITRRQAECDYYWVVTRSYSSTTGLTTRTPNENGYYEIELLKAGDTKNTMYYTKDVNIATAVDYPSDRVVGLKVAEGNIIECVYDLEAVFGNTYFVREYYVLDATGSVATFLSPAGSGYTKNGVVAVGAKVWNVSTVGKYGEETTLQVGDTVRAGKTPIGELSYAYVIRRVVDNGADKFYWRIDDRQYDSKAKETTRTPDAEGYYTYLFAHNGKQVTLRTNNKEFATALDYQSSAPAFTLETKGDIITKVHEGTYSFGGSRYNGWTVDAVNGNEIEVTSSSGTKDTWDISEAKIYNVSNSHTSHKGEQIYSVKVGDVVANYRDINCTPKIIIVKTRETNKMAWPVAPQYSSDVGTLRTPNEKGWYTVDLAVDGKIRTYTVKSKAVMDAIDAYSSPFGIEVKGDEILYMSTTTYVENVKGAGLTTYTVQSVSGSTVKAIYTPGSADNAKTGVSEEFTMSANVKIYDVSDDARLNGTFGQAVKLKKNDVIRTYTDNDGNHLYVFVIAHGTRDYYSYCAHCEKMVYWTPYVPSSNFVAFDSHYYLATDVALTAQMRVYSTARNFEVVLDLNGHNAHRDGGRAGLIRYGDTLTIIDTVGGGKITTKNNTSNGGVFMLSGDSTNGPGVINLYNGTLTVVPSDEPHMYAAQGGIITNSGGIINMYGGEIKDGIVYGKTSTGAVGGNIRISSGGAFNMFGGVVSGGQAFGGTYQAQVKDAEGNKVFDEQGNPVMETLSGTGSGGNIYMESADTTVTIDGGIIKDGKAGRGGNVTVGNGKFTLVNGSVTDGIVAATGYGKSSDGRGGNIFNNGDVYIKGGTVSGGTIIDGYSAGGNIMSTGTADTIFISGDAVVTGGINEDGENDNIYLMYSNLVISGGTVNVPTENGTNIYAYGYTAGASNVTVSGGNIDRIYLNGGSVDAEGNDTRCTLTLSGGRVGHIDASSCGKIAVSGNPIVDYMKPCGAPLEVGEMTKGAAVTLDAVGIFSGENTPNAQAVADNGYFKPYDTVMKVGVTAKGELKIYHPDATAGYCEHCDSEADWMPWTGTVAANGHYFVTGDVQLSEEMILASGAEMVLDLKGYTVTAAENARCFNAKGDLVVMDSSEAKTGTITGGRAIRGGNIYVESTGSFTLRSGTIANGVADQALTEGTSTTNGRGGNIFANGDVNILGGAVINGSTVGGSNMGGNIMMTNTSAVLTVDGDAVISGGSSGSTKNNIYLMYSNLVVNGGEITDGAIGNNGTSSGGNCTITINGGVVDTTITLGGGVSTDDVKYPDYRTALTINGGTVAKIDATKAFGEKVIVSGKPVVKNMALGDGILLDATGIEAGAVVKLAATGVFSTAFADKASAEAAAACISVAGKVIVVTEANELAVEAPPVIDVEKYCAHCGQTVTFSVWDGSVATGHFYLLTDMDVASSANVGSEKDFVLDLNGKTLTADGSRAFYVSGGATLSILDTVGGGVITGGNSNGGRGGNIYASGGNVKLYGGTIVNGTASADGNQEGNNVAVYNGEFVMNGDVVIGNTDDAAKAGHSIYLFNTTSVELVKGTINGKALLRSVKNLTLPSAVYVDLFALRDSNFAVVEERNDGKLITIKMTNGDGAYLTGEFTSALDNANAALAYFKAAVADQEIIVNGEGKLEVVSNKEPEPPVVDPDANCEHCQQKVEWITWDGVTVDGGHYILQNNVELADRLTIKSDMVIDLNGYTITAAADKQAFQVSKKLSILDTSEAKTGTITGGKALDSASTYTSRGGNFVVGGGELNIYGGNIVAGEALSRGGNIYATGNAVVNIYGGVITGGVAATHAKNIFVNYSTLNIYGGVIENTVDNDVYNVRGAGYNGAFTNINIYGGKITGAAALRADDNLAKVTISGGEIEGTTYISKVAAFKVEGKPVISKLTLIESLISVGELTEGASVKVNATAGVITDVLANANDVVKYFAAIKSNCSVVVNAEGKLEVVSDGSVTPPVEPGAHKAFCPHCGQEIEWTAFNGSAATGHFYLTGNVTLAESVSVSSGKDFVLDLNGMTITADGGRAFYVGGGATLSIVDTVGTGIITGGNSNGGRGGNIYASGGNVKLYGGTIVNGTATADGNQEGHNVAVYNGEFVMNGNVVIGDADKEGHSLYLFGTTSTDLVKGTINGKALLRSVKGLTLPSAVSVDLFAMRDSNFAVVEERNDGKLIAVKITNGAGEFLTGAFTSTLENAEAALAYFKAANETQKIIINADGKLQVAAGSVVPDLPIEPCPHCEGAGWVEWNGQATSGHYYLTADTQLTDLISIANDEDVIIDLRGFTITAAEGVKAFDVSGKLSVVDTSEAKSGVITGGSAYRGGNVYVQASGDFTLYAGSIIGGVADTTLGSGTTGGRGGNIFGNGGKVTLKGGVVAGGSTVSGSNWGGNIFMTGGVLTIEEGAVVSGGTAKSGSNIYMMYADLVINGAQITDATGSAIYLNGTAAGNSSLTINNGYVEGTVYSGKVDNEITVSGNVQIGFLDLNGTLINVGELTDGTAIAVDALGVFTTKDVPNAQDVAQKGYFTTDKENMTVGVTANGELKIYNPAAVARYCEHCAADADWMEWTGDKAAEGHYYLTSDVMLAGELKLAADTEFVLDLNGHIIMAAEGKRCFDVYGDMYVLDSSETKVGTITGGTATRGGNIYVNSGALFCLVDGNITNGIADNALGTSSTNGRGGNIFAGGKVVLMGGTVTGGVATTGTGVGGNICVTGGSLTVMGDATVSGGSAKSAGNIYLMYGDLVLADQAEISEGVANSGSNIYATGTEAGGASSITVIGGTVLGGDISMSGGQITNGVDYRTALTIMGGTLDCVVNASKVAADTITISGAPVIAELNLGENVLLSISDIAADAKIGVNNVGVVSYPVADANDVRVIETLKNIVSVIKRTEVVVNELNELEVVQLPLATKEIFCEHCQQTVIFTEWVGTETADSITAASGHYFLTENLNVTKQIAFGSSKDVVIDLNGMTITAEGCRAFYVSGSATLSIVDSVGTGVVTGGNSNGGRGGNIYASGGNVKLYGGTVMGGTAPCDGNQEGHNVAVYNGEFVMNGNVTIGDVDKDGHSLYLFNLKGIELTKGTVIGKVLMRGVKDITLGSEFNADLLAMRDSNFAVVEERAADTAQIAIKVTNAAGEFLKGAFTGTLENAETALTYFASAGEDYKIVVNADGKLEIVDLVTEPVEPPVDQEPNCDHCNQYVEWVEWNGQATAGHYYLVGNVQLEDIVTVESGNEVVIDLKGFTVTAAQDLKCFNVYGNLSILDTSDAKTGVVTGGKAYRGGNIYVQKEGNFTLYGGTITDGVADTALGSGTTGGRGGNIFGNGGNITLKGGAVSGGSTVSGSNWGGNIFMTGGTLTIEEGVVVSGGSAKAGGNIYMMYANLVMNGCEVKDGVVTTDGADIYLNGTEAGGWSTLTMVGGNAGDVYCNNAGVNVTVSGAAKIASLTLKGLLTVGELTDGASVKINATEGVFTDVLANANVATYFDAVDAAYNVAVNADGKLEIVADPNAGGNDPEPEPEPVPVVCPHCGQTVEWVAFDGTVATGHFYLAEDLALTDDIIVATSKDFVLDLNGKTITAGNDRVFYVTGGATLSIVDTVGTGVVTGGNSNGGRGGNIYATGANVKLYGGSIIGGTANTDGNQEGHNVAVYNGVFVMNGNVTIGDVDKDGHSLYLFGTTSTDLVKGTVVGKTLLRSAGNAVLSSKFNTDLLALRDSKITVVEDRSNKIAVKFTNAAGDFLPGVFTDVLTNAEAAKSYFESALANFDIVVTAEGALELVEVAPIEYCACGCGALASEVVWQDANAYILAMSQLAENSGVIVENVHLKLSADLDITAIYGAKKQIVIGGADIAADPDNNKEAFTAPDVNVTIDLNGFTWSSKHRLYNYNGCTVTLMDSSAEGTGVFTSTGYNGSGRVIINYGTFNILSGTITMTEEEAASIATGGVYYQSEGTTNMYGGKIVDGRADGNNGKGGNVNIRIGTFNLYGGEISGGEATLGSNVYVNKTATLNIAGGTIADQDTTVYYAQ